MGVEEPMEVQCLRENDAFDLFQKKVGQITLGSDPMIPILANIVAKKCCGLPLALNVVGETMSCKRTVQQWRHAINVLTSYAAEFSGMEDKILPLLKYSYDSLKGDQVKSCFLYCALFPEDGQISKEKIIDYWICEGIIDGSDGIEKAEVKGYDIIGSLVDASLLMENIDWHLKAFVCMHDVVREMALWIASDLGIQKETFIVRAGDGLYEIPKVKNWNIVKRMALMNSKIIHLADNPKCLVLTTFLLQKGNLSNISSDFFKSMPKLAVLDLSGNRSLSELPEELSKLVSLQYLNLSYTDIRCLPKRLQKFKKLIHFDLEHTWKLESIDGISSLHNLKVLKLQGSGFPWHLDTEEELEALEHLEILTAGIYSRSYAVQFVNSHRLMSCTQSLSISFTFDLESFGISLPATMDKLRDFSIWNCSISEIKMGRICSFLSLVKVHIDGCKCLRELTFLMFAPNLKSLLVRYADQLEDIINKEKACEVENSQIVPFPNLNHLLLECLPKLKNIYWSILPFPYLKEIEVVQCPNLRKLPLDSQSGMQGYDGLFIRCPTDDWIRNVEWEDEATKTRFLPSRRQSDDLDVPEDYDL